MDPRQLSHELRNGTSDELQRRRAIFVLSLVGALMGKIVGLYQVGILKNLPDPPIELFDSARVDASTYAYKRLNSPDGPLMFISYGVTAWLAALDGDDRARRSPWAALLLTGKILSDIVLAVKLAQEEWAENRALCFYCQVATVASIVSLLLAWPETRRALDTLND